MQGQANTERRIKALLCQIAPSYKDKNSTIQAVNKSLALYDQTSGLDLVMFPELALAGCNFKDTEEATDVAVEKGSGVDFAFFSDIAARLKCSVAFGYMEREEIDSQTQLYNSAAVVNHKGDVICHHRKKHLYCNDKLWAKSSQDPFPSFVLPINSQPQKSIRCTLAIGADIHPKDFSSSEYQLADQFITAQSELLILLASWQDSANNKIHSNDVTATYNYWIHRLTPLVKSSTTSLVLICDRTGQQYDYFAKKVIAFYGSSCGMMFNPTKVIKNLDAEHQGYLVIDTFLP